MPFSQHFEGTPRLRGFLNDLEIVNEIDYLKAFYSYFESQAMKFFGFHEFSKALSTFGIPGNSQRNFGFWGPGAKSIFSLLNRRYRSCWL